MNLKILKLTSDAIVPKYAKDDDAAFDLCSVETRAIMKGEHAIIKTGISMEIPNGFFGSVRDRSGLAAKNAIHTMAGVIDSGYRGEIGVVLVNLGKEDFHVGKGMRIAQMIIQKCEHVTIIEIDSKIDSLSESSRGTTGFGSTGLK